ncbi:hypothetical protein SERLA73DRAFT_175928 [Serpula lacrymans var. lacrymans S7.3]|uniref:DUF6534 domain-containing protein n=2 Tax=Serpula lacrymans var. lacrymans TaxID=341189 RepID=F8PK06_SERL3|nr:uncharacterized protein SERLADRAFT_458586 [Serpula lacrymans var. lacrymans S7.9]EGO04143.1 hypothetical protein SERLA73DRAFT_175928 [Serpula lacrymans var. lacrymans S7.3]EGO30074.1 hypothetical protein SERLADRAFT_458586 [Serpula lacrymans var. lacrymans S7.9]
MTSRVLVPTLGAVLIGNFISTTLYGMTSMQIYYYYSKFWNKDARNIKSVVLLLWLLETVHTFLICSFTWRSLVLEFNDPAARARTQVSDDVTTGITGSIIFLVHCFYARRIWILSLRNKLLVSIVSILAVCHFVLEIGVMALTFKWPEFSQFHRIEPYYTASLAVAAANDIIITVSIVYLLASRRSGLKSTNTIVSRIISYVISSGVLTSVTDVAILICFVTMPGNLIYLALYQFINNRMCSTISIFNVCDKGTDIDPVYANSLLATLNARESLREVPASANILSQGVILSDFRAMPGSHSHVELEADGSSTKEPTTLTRLSFGSSEPAYNKFS